MNFSTNPQGDVDKVTMSLDEAEATFVRRAATLDPAVAQRLAGTYETATGAKFQVVMRRAAGFTWCAWACRIKSWFLIKD